MPQQQDIRASVRGWCVLLAALVAIAVGGAAGVVFVTRSHAAERPRSRASGAAETQSDSTGEQAAGALGAGPSGSKAPLAPPEAAPNPRADLRRTAEIRRALEALIDAGLGGLWGETPPPPAPAAATSSQMPGPDPSLHNQADAGLGEYVAGRIHDDFRPMAKSCYENALAKSPSLRGKVSVRFTIVGDRRVGAVVESAEIDDATDIKDPMFLECLKQSMMTVNFAPPPDGAREISSVFAMRFAPSSN